MIDFRYHLVSLVSVFLALAVGIVLGAGPLKESLGDTLTDQVAALRTDRDGLRADLARADVSLDHRDDFISALGPSLVRDQLTGRTVTVVLLPGADRDTVEALEQALKDAGSVVTGRAELTDAWVDSGQDGARDDLARQLAPTLMAATQAATATPGQILASVLVTGETAQSGPMSEARLAALAKLRDAGLVQGDATPTQRATALVVVAPPVPVDAVKADLEARRDAAPKWRDLIAALGSSAGGIVLEGPASAAGSAGILEAVRDGDAGDRVSTVDTGGTSMGAAAAVLALSEQIRGQSGHYGFADGARAPLAPLPAGAGS